MLNLLARIKANPNYKWWVASAMAVSVLMSVADIQLVNIAIPTISEEFHSSLSTVQWLTAGQLVAISALLLPMGRLSDMIGRKKVYIWGLSIFVIGAGLGALSSNIGTLILVRVIQGLGLGMVWGNQVAIMASIFPKRERGTILGVHIILVGLGMIMGPLLGGLLVDLFGWRSVFLAQIPWGLMAILPSLLILDESLLRKSDDSPQGGKFDFTGAALSVAALLTFIFAMTSGHRVGWFSPTLVSALIAALAFAAAFVWWELRSASPMLDLSLFSNSVFSLGVGARFLSFITVGASMFLMPFYLQGPMGYSATKSGLVMTTLALGLVVLGPIGGRLSDRFGWRPFNVLGSCIAAIGFLIFYNISYDAHLALIILALVLQGGGTGMFSPTNTSSVFGAVGKSRYGIVSALLELMRNFSNMTGVVCGTLIVTATMASMGFGSSFTTVADQSDFKVSLAFTSGMRTVFLVLVGLQILVAILSLIQGGNTRMFGQRSEDPDLLPKDSQN